MPKEHSQRRINLIFTIAIVNVGFAILCTVLSDHFDFVWLRNYNAINIIAYVAAAFLAKKRILTPARVIYLLTSSIGIAVISSFTGKNGSVEFVYMFNIGLPFIMFSYRRERLMVIMFTLIPLILWALLYITDYNLFATKKLDPIIACLLYTSPSPRD